MKRFCKKRGICFGQFREGIQGILHLSILFFLLTSCGEKQNGKQFRIGFSQCVESDAWRKTMLEEMKRELSFHTNVTLLYRQADGNSQKQINQVQDLLNENIDLLIISPNEAEPLTDIVDKTFHQGIPVIVVDRKISTSFYTAYVGGDNYGIGKLAAIYAYDFGQRSVPVVFKYFISTQRHSIVMGKYQVYIRVLI